MSQSLAKGQYQRLSNYLAFLLSELEKFGSANSYKDYGKPLYRGVAIEHVN